jgi:hypothetical protein
VGLAKNGPLADMGHSLMVYVIDNKEQSYISSSVNTLDNDNLLAIA